MARFSFIALIVGVLLVGTKSAKLMKRGEQRSDDSYECFNADGQQIPVDYLCDGTVDCLHEDDEWWCGGSDSYSNLPDVPYFPECDAGQFMCRDSTCVDGWCDGKIDCDTAEDETDCGVGPFFYCRTDDDSEYPIHIFQVCDRILDCQYYDDETNCGYESIYSFLPQ